MGLKSRSDIPEQPGVYLFKEGDAILYIGKAGNLKKRISQYFQGRNHLIADNLLQRADDIEYIVTGDEKDALQLEYNLIHTYRPPLNVRLKDDKGFLWLEITLDEVYPGIYLSRRETVRRGARYVGPVVNAFKARALVEALARIFRLRVCGESRFRRGMVCLYYYIDRCAAPCVGKITPEICRRNALAAVELLKGKREGVIRELQIRMNELAENLEFEAAQTVKEDIALLSRFSLDTFITTVKRASYDATVCYWDAELGECFAVVFSVAEGRAARREFIRFQTLGAEAGEVFQEFLMSWYRGRMIPSLILAPHLPPGSETLEKLLSDSAGRKVVIRVPARGDKQRMLALAARNLHLFIQKSDYKPIGRILQEKLKLGKFPQRIEGYDISHFSGRERVGARVVFTGGRPERRRFRNYIIREAGPGDVDALREVLRRRFRGEGDWPDLVLIDGGSGQLGVGLEVREELALDVDIIALAKEEERVYLADGSSIVFPLDAPERYLLQNVRDEAHRRAVTHHRKRRQVLPR